MHTCPMDSFSMSITGPKYEGPDVSICDYMLPVMPLLTGEGIESPCQEADRHCTQQTTEILSRSLMIPQTCPKYSNVSREIPFHPPQVLCRH